MTIQDYVRKIELAERFFNTADIEYQEIANERLTFAKKELDLYIKACKLNGTKGMIQRV